MWMNVLVLGILIIFVLWTSSQGFFSSILQFGCVVVAGAIAFAVWEPVYYLLFTKFDKPWGYDIGWGVSLLLSFALARLLLQMISDKACPANVFLTDTPNWIGSGFVGILSGIITAGFLLIGVEFIQGPTRMLGYQAWTLDSDATIIRQDKLWIPVDEIVEYIYSKGSQGPMYSSSPMTEWQPMLAQQASLFRTSYGEGASRMGMKPDGIEPKRLIRIAPFNPATFVQNLPGVTDPTTGRKLTNGDVYAVRLFISNAAGDDNGQLRLSKGQVRLVVQLPSGEFVPVYPHAVYEKYLQNLPNEGRFEFEVGDDYAVSVGVGAEIKMGFEFAVSQGATPQYIVMRNVRSMLTSLRIEDMTETELKTLIASGQM